MPIVRQTTTDPELQRLILAVDQLSLKVDRYFLKLMQTIAQPRLQETMIMSSLSDIADAVAAETTIEESVATLLDQLSMELQAAIASEDPDQMQAIVDSLDANKKALSDAITRNTPAVVTPPVVPPTP